MPRRGCTKRSRAVMCWRCHWPAMPRCASGPSTPYITCARFWIEEEHMLSVTRDMVMPTAITGSYPRPLWYDVSLSGQSFKTAMGDSLFREQYIDAVAAVINAQEAAGLDIVTDGDARFDL